MRHSHRFASCLALTALALPAWADAPKTPPVGGTAHPVLDKLVGKHEVVGLTERGGSRFLGRVLSGDHGLYVVQTFHYVSSPATTLQTTTVTTFTARGRPKTSRVTRRVTSQSVLADDVAVRALLSGVAGPSYHPHEETAGREMVAATDVICIQELSPPAKAKAPSLLMSPANAPPLNLPASTGWTIKTLWASAELPASKASGKALAK